MDGFEACRRLRAHPTLGRVPILLVTALDDRESRLRGIEAGADDFVSKPFDRIELRARIRTILRLDRSRRILEERVRFERLLERSGEGFLLLDGEGRLLRSNRPARILLALPEGSGILLWDHLRGKGFGEPVGLGVEALGTAPDPLLIPRFPLGGGETVWVELEPLAGEEGEERLLRCRDVGEQLRNRRQGWAFHALAGHKLRTPLTVAISHVDRLCREYPCRRTEIARQELWRLTRVVETVLRYVGQVGRGEGRCPAERLRESLPLLEERFPTAIFELECPEPGAVLPLSPEALELILLELAGNSVKFHPRLAPRVTIRLERSGGRLRLRVEDDGVEPTPEQVRLAFVPYRQGESPFTGSTEGMGLGLPLVASLVSGVGGSFSFGPRQGGSGARVDLDLPEVPREER